MDSWDAGRKPFGTVVPAGPPPGWSPTGLREGRRETSGAGENARRLVDKIVGTPEPVTIESAFGVVFAKLGEFPGNTDLIGQVEGLRQAIVDRLAEQRATRRGAMEKQLEELRAECRLKLDRVRSLHVEMNSWDSRISAFGERASEARAEANGIRGDEPRSEDYPTPAEMEDWAARVRAAEGVVGDAEGRQRWAENEQTTIRNELQQAIDQFKVAEAAEQTLSARLAGHAYPGPLGIVHPPESL
jgi:hypothetical protein